MNHSSGTPKDFRGAVSNAFEEICKPGPHNIQKATLKQAIEDVFYHHFMDRLRKDLCTAMLNGESIEQFIEKLKEREGWDHV